MTITGLKFTPKPPFPFCPSLFPRFRLVRLRSAAVAEDQAKVTSRVSAPEEGDKKIPKWKKLNSKDLGISSSMIAKPTRKVLNALKKQGYDVYLVGGCVRDLILKRTPKDFDIITSAQLKEVMRTFSWCEIVGKRFPICHVHLDGIVVEVSSFSTNQKKYGAGVSAYNERSNDSDEKEFIRWRNCMQRDFTINGLMFDPYARTIYDYMGGLEDLRKAKVRTVIPAKTSFQEDCARILRAIRIAARLGFGISRETAQCIKHQSTSILKLDKGRLLMEMNYMLAYGSAEASLRSLWRFGLLDVLLPFQAAYFVRCGFRRHDKGTNMLLTLFSNLDKLLAPDRPCHSCLWVSILALHEALCYQPRDPLAVAAFSIAVHNGGDLRQAVSIAKTISKPHDVSFSELLDGQSLDTETLIKEIRDLVVSVRGALCKMTDEHFVSQAMQAYPKAPYSDLVLIPFGLYLKVCRIFECVKDGPEKGFVPKKGGRINYDSLSFGSLSEVRHVFARDAGGACAAWNYVKFYSRSSLTLNEYGSQDLVPVIVWPDVKI